MHIRSLFTNSDTYVRSIAINFCINLMFYSLSRSGRVIIMSIHQPRYSIYKLFDSLTLMSRGRIVYHGPAANALNYFFRLGE